MPFALDRGRQSFTPSLHRGDLLRPSHSALVDAKDPTAGRGLAMVKYGIKDWLSDACLTHSRSE